MPIMHEWEMGIEQGVLTQLSPHSQPPDTCIYKYITGETNLQVLSDRELNVDKNYEEYSWCKPVVSFSRDQTIASELLIV